MNPHHYLGQFLENVGDFIEEQDGKTHQDIRTMED